MKKFPWVLVALLATSLAVFQPSAQSQEPTSASPGAPLYVGTQNDTVTVELITTAVGTLPAPGQEELSDLKTAEGNNSPETIARYAGVSQFEVVTDKVSSLAPKLFVAAGVSADQNVSDFWVRLTGAPTPAITRLLSAQPFRVEIQQAPGIPVSKQDALYTGLIDAANTAEPSVGAYRAGYANDLKSIQVYWDPKSGLPLADIAERTVASAAYKVGLDTMPLRVEFVSASNENVAQDTVKGGHELCIQGPNCHAAGLCTTGFSVNRGGTLGAVSARHCSSTLAYDNTTGIVANCCVADPSDNGTIDLRFYRTTDGNLTTKAFRATNTTQRDVADTANPVQNAPICHFGLGSYFFTSSKNGYSCDNVASATPFCAMIGDVPYSGETCGLMDTYNDISTGGDSGGPWFYNFTANGIHESGNSNESTFTRIGTISNNLNAFVLQ